MAYIDIIITNSGEVPIYQQIVDQIKAAILRGELNSDMPLPSIRMLAKELQISVITTKRAYEELEKESWIYTIPGKGSFVAEFGEELLEESTRRMLTEKLKEVIGFSQMMGVSKSELSKIFKSLLEGE